MKKYIKYLIVSICTLSTLIVLKSVYAETQYQAGFVLSPTSQKVSLEPGEKYRSSVKISNPATSNSESHYVLYVTPYGVSNEQYDPVFDQKNTYTQIVDWITLDKTEGYISPNEMQEIGFTIDVPENAPAGGQYATIMLQGVNDNVNKPENGVLVNDITAIGSIIVADIAGITKEEGKIIENTVPSFLLNNNLEAISLIRNDGNVHANASITLQVWPLIGNEEICTNEEEPSTEIILPETQKYHIETCKLPLVGIFRLKQSVKIFNETSQLEKIIIVCPLWLLFIIIFVIVALIIWLVLKVKNRKTANN